MLSLAPFFSDTSAPGLSNCKFYDNLVDRDLARFHAIMNEERNVTHRQPNYSLVENDEKAHLEVELPGVSKQNVNLDMTGNKLVITGKRFRAIETVGQKPAEKNSEDEEQDEKEVEEPKPSQEPKPSVMYELKLLFGNRYDTNSVHATMDGDGILKMVVPMKKKESSRKIDIK